MSVPQLDLPIHDVVALVAQTERHNRVDVAGVFERPRLLYPGQGLRGLSETPAGCSTVFPPDDRDSGSNL